MPVLQEGPWWPFAPLEDLVMRRAGGRVNGGVWIVAGRHDGHQPLDAIAKMLGCTVWAVLKYRQRGLQPWRADEFCTRLGLHPMHVWPAEYSEWIPDDVPTQAHRRRLRREQTARARAKLPQSWERNCPVCGATFTVIRGPGSSKRKWCSPRCAQLEANALRRRKRQALARAT